GTSQHDLAAKQCAEIVRDLHAVSGEERSAAGIDDVEVVDHDAAEQTVTAHATDAQLAIHAVGQPADSEALRALHAPVGAREKEDGRGDEQQSGHNADSHVTGESQRARHVRTPVQSKSGTATGPRRTGRGLMSPPAARAADGAYPAR